MRRFVLGLVVSEFIELAVVWKFDNVAHLRLRIEAFAVVALR